MGKLEKALDALSKATNSVCKILCLCDQCLMTSPDIFMA